MFGLSSESGRCIMALAASNGLFLAADRNTLTVLLRERLSGKQEKK